MMRGMAVETSLGSFTAFFSECGLVRLEFPQSRSGRPIEGKRSEMLSLEARQWATLTRRALEQVLAGQRPEALPPLDWSGRTAFQCEVWEALLRIGPGETRTYAQIATELGKPRATRATGGACGANPIPVLVPCHRVVAAHGGLGGFSAGLDWKRRLLAREGISIQ